MTDDDRFAGLNAEERLDARQREKAESRRPAKVISSVRDIPGDLRFRSPVRITAAIVAALGMAGAVIQQLVLIGYAGAGVAGLLLLYGLSSVRRLALTAHRRVELRGFGRSPMPLDQFRYARCFASPGRFPQPAVVVFYRRPRSPLLSGLGRIGARFLPGVTRRRAVLFFSWWRAADGRLVTANAVESLLKQACRRSGFEITELGDSAWIAQRPAPA